jgi:hypothetical protein
MSYKRMFYSSWLGIGSKLIGPTFNGAARATATRDLSDLVEKDALVQTGALKSTSYWLAVESLQMQSA